MIYINICVFCSLNDRPKKEYIRGILTKNRQKDILKHRVALRHHPVLCYWTTNNLKPPQVPKIG